MKKQPHKYDFALVFCPRWGVNTPWTASGHLLEAVRSRGLTAQYLDYNVRLFHTTGVPELWEDNSYHLYWKTQPLDYFLKRIDLREISAPIVGFSLTDSNLRFSITLARKLREIRPDVKIVFGGHRIFFPEDPGDGVPLDACDVIVKGEGELTLLDILENGIHDNPGTYTQRNGKWEFNGERPLIDKLDMFPWPRYEDVNWRMFPGRAVSIMGSRGCIFDCSFCNDIIRAGHRYRRRSAEHIAEEMLHHKDRYRRDYAIFADPLMNGHFPGFDELCEILLKRQYGGQWAGNLAIRANMPKELLTKARRAGLDAAILGLECGSPRVLKLMRKRFTVEEAECFIAALHEADISIDLNIIVGFPGETEEDFRQTLDFLTKIAPKLRQVTSVATFNLDHSYLWNHLAEYDIVRHEHDRHITWHTADNSNTYEIRLQRAQRLIRHLAELGVQHARFDADIERADNLASIRRLQFRRKKLLLKHYTKKALQHTGILAPLMKLKNIATNQR